ncbi:hypothetical protein [Streptomyces sp. NPDC046985]|uniref:hypothetical protein n=1 Tax=Streptomyces sp. NPDC046985 TaxID=3155377 RepID=UPI0033E7066D
MLTPTPAEERLAVGERSSAYRCWAAAYPARRTRPVPLGSHRASSSRLALRWLRERTRHVTDQLDTAYAQPGRHWLTDDAEHERALALLTMGSAYRLTLYDEDARYVLVASPPGGGDT